MGRLDFMYGEAEAKNMRREKIRVTQEDVI